MIVHSRNVITLSGLAEGDVLTRQKAKDRQVYVLVSGQVMAIDVSEALPRFLQYYSTLVAFLAQSATASLTPWCAMLCTGSPAYFGEWECLFDVPERVCELLAGSDVVVYSLQENEFLDLLSYQAPVPFPCSLHASVRELGDVLCDRAIPVDVPHDPRLF
jgi:hypothetical protein